MTLLVSKLSEEVYKQYSKRIFSKKDAENYFEETVKMLEAIFDVNKSLFSHRFTCINLVQDGDSMVAYMNKVNAMCKETMLKDINREGWKAFFWLSGLES